MTDDDSDIRPQFERLKREDARSLRPFSLCWEAARQTVGRRDRWSLNVSAIAVAMVLLVIGVFAVQFRSSRQASIHQISQWRSPTSSLLKTPGDQLFKSLPRIAEPPNLSFKEQRN
jgi:hypothetical protein